MSEPSVPPPLPPTPPSPPAPPSTGAVVVAVLALVVGLILLVPGGICSVLAVGMQFDGGAESRQLGVFFAVVGLPILLGGVALIVFGVRRLRRPRP